MRIAHFHSGGLLALAATGALFLVGCGQGGGGQQGSADAGGKEEPAKVAQAKNGHDHSGWWCAEHGIPEEECSMCSDEVAQAMKKKGDWCEEHDRGKSQCFLCDPSLKEKFANKYRAKYGKEPPPIEE